jgi:hypothetical protein
VKGRYFQSFGVRAKPSMIARLGAGSQAAFGAGSGCELSAGVRFLGVSVTRHFRFGNGFSKVLADSVLEVPGPEFPDP